MAQPTTPSPFSATQWRLISGALTLLAVGATLVMVVVGVRILAQFLLYFSGILWPLAVAGVLALVLRPLVLVLEKRLHLHRPAAVVLLFGLFLLVAAAACMVLLPPLFIQLLDFVDYLPTLWARARDYVHGHYPQWVALAQHQLDNPAIQQAAQTALAKAKTMLVDLLPSVRVAGGDLLGIFGFGANLALIPAYLFYFLLAKGTTVEKLSPNLPFLSAGLREDVIFLVREFIGIVESFFSGQLLVALIMGGLLALGFTLIGLKFGLILGLLIGGLNIVRFLGTIVGLVFVLAVALLQPEGGWHLFGLAVLVTAIVQAIEGIVLTPRIVEAKIGLHPVTITVALLFWGTALGTVLGTLLAIPLTAFFVTVWRLLKQKYLQATA